MYLHTIFLAFDLAQGAEAATHIYQCPREGNGLAAGGVILGDLPPYEAFPIGGTNSVRGYSEGGVGSGRNYVAGTTALQWPIFGPVDVSTSFSASQPPLVIHRPSGEDTLTM